MFSISAAGVPVPPVVTLYLALIFTAVARQKDAWDRREPPESVVDIDARPVLHLSISSGRRAYFRLETNRLDDDRMLLHAPYDCPL